ncbi:MAG: hypothetical protein ACRDT0_16725, partial [Pseudonocardiaceae bacterium]
MTQVWRLHPAQVSRRIRTRPFVMSASHGSAVRRRNIPVMAGRCRCGDHLTQGICFSRSWVGAA